ncbi:HAMP domain-containing histidine kinase [Clostridium niameyense]|uniref:histidine kinase n=1 Tax=Clostridium niameyense TaxID=1622073 RepID=A0A6M0RDR6_9CLOT|nr:sensor histidine kinase [Clostridium niameyense]NEZ47749.1 HAMP domain-containing histidine kinase [Clostridium niameyense]
MRVIDYLKERSLYLGINLILFIIIALIMKLLNFGTAIIFLVFCIWFFPLITYIILELIKSKLYYDDLTSVIENLDKKYLLPEVIKKPKNIEQRVIYNVLREANKDMHEKVNKYRDMQVEYREYIETWVHEIKTPIASTRLMIANNQNKVTENIEYEIKKIESFIDQVLYYARSTEVSKDYLVKEFKLKTVIENTIKRNSKDFINKRIALNIENVDINVFSDAKWVEFILNQIIGNALKYSKPKEGRVNIYATKNKNSITLTIEDNGVGIPTQDIGRIFEKSFTGENGRKFGKSTGIGLYICKKLCTKLGLGLEITSEKFKGTRVLIIFPLGELTKF